MDQRLVDLYQTLTYLRNCMVMCSLLSSQTKSYQEVMSNCLRGQLLTPMRLEYVTGHWQRWNNKDLSEDIEDYDQYTWVETCSLYQRTDKELIFSKTKQSVEIRKYKRKEWLSNPFCRQICNFVMVDKILKLESELPDANAGNSFPVRIKNCFSVNVA